MGDMVSIVVEVPRGKYCAVFGEDMHLINKCPLLKRCETSSGAYYCPIANSDCHCGQDATGILKQHERYDSSCPSLYREKIRELLRKVANMSR